MDELQNNQVETEAGQPGMLTNDELSAPETPAPVAAPANDFDPNQWALNYQGQRIIPKDKQHLINLAQQGHGYSQKMEDLKKRAAEIEAAKGKYGQYEVLDQRLKENPELAQKLVQALSQQEGAAPISPEQLQMKQTLEELNQFKSQFYQQQADTKIQGEVKEIQGKYKNFDWNTPDENGMTLQQRVIKNAIDKNISHLPLEVSLRDLMFDHVATSAKADALKTVTEQQRQNVEAGKVLSGTRPAPKSAGIGYQEGDSYNDLEEKALKMMT